MISKLKRVIKNKIRNEHTVDDYRKMGAVIGENTKILSSNIDAGHAYLVEIGKNCTLTHCTVLAHDASTQIFLRKSKVGIVKIGDNTFVGYGSIILPNVKIGSNCIIGAGSVVTKNVPDNSVAAGNPCKVICSTDEYINKHKEYMKIKPVFDKYCSDKTIEEKQNEKKLLENDFGYDE